MEGIYGTQLLQGPKSGELWFAKEVMNEVKKTRTTPKPLDPQGALVVFGEGSTGKYPTQEERYARS